MPDEDKKSRWDYLGKTPFLSDEPRLKEMLTFQDKCEDCRWFKILPSGNSKEMVCVLYGERGFSEDRPIPERCVGKVGRKY